MARIGMDIDQIADLTTDAATTGSMALTEIGRDNVFDYIIGVAILVYRTNPNK